MGLVLLLMPLVNFPYSNFILALRQRPMYLNIQFAKTVFTNCLEIVTGINLTTCFLTHAVTEYISLKPEDRLSLEKYK